MCLVLRLKRKNLYLNIGYSGPVFGIWLKMNGVDFVEWHLQTGIMCKVGAQIPNQFGIRMVHSVWFGSQQF